MSHKHTTRWVAPVQMGMGQLTQNREDDVKKEMLGTAHLEEDTQGRQNNSQDDLADIAVIVC